MHGAFDRMTGDPAGYCDIPEAIGMAMTPAAIRPCTATPNQKTGASAW
jgi:hypothetical protein